MTVKLMIFLLIGTAAMGVPILNVSRKYRIPLWKGTVVTLLLTVAGTTGTFLMYYLENGRFGGLSFYGAVFLVPMVFAAVAPMLRIPYGNVMDLCAVGECIMLALMKVHCMLGGCCVGRVLFVTATETVRFPSREAELVAAIVIFAVLLRWAMTGKKNGQLYAWYLVVYGCSRFVLNIFREAWAIKEMVLPFGNIWSLVAIVAGLLWLFIRRKSADTVKEPS